MVKRYFENIDSSEIHDTITARGPLPRRAHRIRRTSVFRPAWWAARHGRSPRPAVRVRNRHPLFRYLRVDMARERHSPIEAIEQADMATAALTARDQQVRAP